MAVKEVHNVLRCIKVGKFPRLDHKTNTLESSTEDPAT